MNLSQLWTAHYIQWIQKQQGMLPPQLGAGATGPPPEVAMMQGLAMQFGQNPAMGQQKAVGPGGQAAQPQGMEMLTADQKSQGMRDI
jgi:hypothetical protein